MRFFDLPRIEGTPEEQLRQIKDFLFLQSEALNHNLENSDAEKQWAHAKDVLTRSAAAETDTETQKNGYARLRDLIIGTADLAVRSGDSFTKVLEEVYGVKSDFGVFTETINTTIEATARQIVLSYNYDSRITAAQNTADGAASDAAAAQSTADETAAFQLNQKNYIKTGFIDEDGQGAPIFGIDVGLLSQQYIEDGQTIANATPHKIRITPGKISFFEGAGNALTEVAYITGGAIHFPNAEITGGTIQIGNKFSVTNQGVMTATDGTFTGTVNATSGSIGNLNLVNGWLFGNPNAGGQPQTWITADTLAIAKTIVASANKVQISGNLIAGRDETIIDGIYDDGLGRLIGYSLHTMKWVNGQPSITSTVDNEGAATFKSLTVGGQSIVDTNGMVNVDRIQNATASAAGLMTKAMVNLLNGLSTSVSGMSGDIGAMQSDISGKQNRLTTQAVHSLGFYKIANNNLGQVTQATAVSASDITSTLGYVPAVQIGSKQKSGSRNTTISSNTWDLADNFTLSGSGTYLVTGAVRFDPNAEFYRAVKLSEGSGSGASDVDTASSSSHNAGGGSMVLRVTRIVEVSGSTTMYLYAYQNTGSSIQGSYYWEYIKLK